MITLPPNEQQPVTRLLANSPTRCVGTYLIDLPAQFKPYNEGTLYYNSDQDITITAKQQYLPPFKQMVALREQELKNTKPLSSSYGNYLKAIYPVPTNQPNKMQGIIFERMESPGTDDSARILEGYRWQDEVTLKIEMEVQNGSDKKHDKNRIKHPELYTNNVPQKLIELGNLFDRIKPRDDLIIPTTPGFCMFNSFMQGEDREWKDMNYGYLHDKINYFSFYFEFNDFAADYALLNKPEVYFTQGSGHTIYKGTRESHGLKLEEWVVKGRYFDDPPKFYSEEDRDYVFTLGIHSTDPTYKTPQLRIEMTYRMPEDETQGFTEKQLMVIWREVTNSIQMRDSAFKSN
ncbi:T6SS immunity protein Tli4 family protein [uncultured Gilliamella sp.]|uniref:T6SS immunity protein Tli4 family protein n=1 Tax=uncultured Gilliamella sp. TaxID=1193505 RepID=UPI0025F6A372|nr:T6SS immunity protein Tli4 family protein [uncultured Gilliamella sp.]